MPDNALYLAKFGRKEHLESIKRGYLFFNPISKYRDDTSAFRGDKFEGMVPIDPSTMSIGSGGKEWFTDLGVPRPVSAFSYFQNDEKRFIFCAAMITKEVSVKMSKSEFALGKSFKNSVRQFGDYVLLFSANEINHRLHTNANVKFRQIGFESGPIIYRDLSIFSGDYHTAYSITNCDSDRYFVKDKKYKDQNEWRILIDGYYQHLEPNCGEGYSLFVGELEWAYLFETATFLETLLWKE